MENRMQLRPVTVTRKKGREKDDPDFLQVKPAEITIHPGDELEFTFNDCRNPTIMIPVEGILTERIATDNSGTIRMRVRVEPNLTQADFPYAIYSPDIRNFAVGNSPPRMILEKNPDN